MKVIRRRCPVSSGVYGSDLPAGIPGKLGLQQVYEGLIVRYLKRFGQRIAQHQDPVFRGSFGKYFRSTHAQAAHPRLAVPFSSLEINAGFQDPAQYRRIDSTGLPEHAVLQNDLPHEKRRYRCSHDSKNIFEYTHARRLGNGSLPIV